MARLNGFTKKQLIEVFSLMVTARELDLKMLILLKQGKGFFHMGCSGHEASQVAAAYTLNQGKDWSYPYYSCLLYTSPSPRDRTRSRMPSSA